MRTTERRPGFRMSTIFLVALSLSIGWGVRGQWGHETGAMIPGVMAALAACLLSGREDWRERMAHFAFFGAVGWYFGGSMSYGAVIGYTHSGHFPSQTFGLGSLFLIGFLWGAVAGAFSALPAILDSKKLTSFYPALGVMVLAWVLPGALIATGLLTEDQLDWRDSDWWMFLPSLLALLVYAGLRRHWDTGTSFLVHMLAGWWVGFLVLATLLGLRMTPPRSDNWAGVVGMTGGIFLFFHRKHLHALSYVTALVGLWGGIGFAGCDVLKLVGMKSGLATNWHSLLEQSYGFVNGIGIALALGYLATRTDSVSEKSNVRPWTVPFAVAFCLLPVTYFNIRKNVEAIWLKYPSCEPVLRPEMYGLSAHTWFDLAYLCLAATLILLWVWGRKRDLEVMPSSWLGKGQLFYLVFLWWIVLGNAARLTPFHPQRLVTEGVIHVHACICTLLVLLLPRKEERIVPREEAAHDKSAWKTLCWSVVLCVVLSLGGAGFLRLVHGHQVIGGGEPELRFQASHSPLP